MTVNFLCFILILCKKKQYFENGIILKVGKSTIISFAITTMSKKSYYNYVIMLYVKGSLIILEFC
jgi:hypothetical protein